eukprot:1148632-Pelagomonas_calceolata.AAC.1
MEHCMGIFETKANELDMNWLNHIQQAFEHSLPLQILWVEHFRARSGYRSQCFRSGALVGRCSDVTIPNLGIFIPNYGTLKEAKLTPIHKKGPVIDPGNYRMIAVSGMLHRLYANLLRSMIQDWCSQHNKILDTQFGFYPGRSTLQPLFILRHLRDVAQKVQGGSSRLYTAFIDFK